MLYQLSYFRLLLPTENNRPKGTSVEAIWHIFVEVLSVTQRYLYDWAKIKAGL
jgi:hypothetical protein